MAWKLIWCIVLLSGSLANAQSNWATARVHEVDYQHQVRNAALTPEQNLGLRAALGGALKGCADFKGIDNLPYGDMRIEKVSLGADSNGYAVQAIGNCLCGATGNCAFWLFDSQMHLLLTDEAQGFAILSQSTNGMRDIVFSLHDSALDSEHTLFKFDGRQYVRHMCADVHYALEPEQNQKNPTVTLHPCTGG